MARSALRQVLDDNPPDDPTEDEATRRFRALTVTDGLETMIGKFIPCPDWEDLPWNHPRIVGRRFQKLPTEPPFVLKDRTWQLNCLWEKWRALIGEVPYALFAKRVKSMQDVYTFTQLWRAVDGFYDLRLCASDRDQPFMTIHRFAESIADAVRIGSMPYKVDGSKTERGQMMSRGF